MVGKDETATVDGKSGASLRVAVRDLFPANWKISTRVYDLRGYSMKSLTFGDDAERTFRTDEEPTKIRSHRRFPAGHGVQPGRISGLETPPENDSLGSLTSLDHFAVRQDHSQAVQVINPQKSSASRAKNGAPSPKPKARLT